MGLRGPQPDGNTAELRTTIPPEFDRALAQLVELSGVAKATFVRQALGDMLSAMGLVYPEVADSLKPKRTAGRVSAATMKRKRT
jgi:hypothetical protein